MGLQVVPSTKEKGRFYRTATIWFPDEGKSLELNVPESSEPLLKQMENHFMRPCRVTISVREFKGVRFVDLVGYQVGMVAAAKSS
jgi:hypothetical protein